jgi:hypothetical protein
MNAIDAQVPAAPLRTTPQKSEARTVAFGPIAEKHRRLVVRLIFTIYLLALFEGVLRKWVAPQWGRPLFFIRDPFVLAIYILVFSRRTRFRMGILEMGCLFAAAGLVLIVAQQIGNTPLPPVLVAYGWRNYFFYLPLAFIIGRYLELRDLELLVNATALISVAMSILIIVQFFSPPGSPINAGLGDNPDDIYVNMGLPGGFVRVTGTWTSNLGVTAFAASAVAFAISMWLARNRSRSLRSYVLLACSTAGALVCVSLSGSRGAYVWSGLILVMAVGGLSLSSGLLGVRAGVLITVLVASGCVIIPVLFPDAIRSFQKRWSGAEESEEQAYGSGGIFGRAVYEVFSFRFLLEKAPLQGYGLGSAGNGAWRLGTRSQVIDFTDSEEVAAAETDWGRNILELGPVFGCMFIAYRVVFVMWMGKTALAATMRSGHPLPWLLFAFVGVMMFNGQITANGTANAYGWLFTGFCLAAANSVPPGGARQMSGLRISRGFRPSPGISLPCANQYSSHNSLPRQRTGALKPL